MATNITFRKTDSALNKPSATTVKNAPLSSLEIDGNFKSIKDNLDEMIEGGVGKLVQRHDVVSLGEQTIFDLPFSYTPGTDALMVFVNGVLGVAGSRYTETSSTRITMTPALALGDKVTVMANVSPINNLPYNPVDGRKDLFVAGTHYTKNITTSVTLSSAPAKSNTVKVFFDGVYQNKDTYYLIGNVLYFGVVGSLVAIPVDTVEVQYEIPSEFVGLSVEDNAILTAVQHSAQASANAAAASFDSFDDRYLGSKSVAPTVDNDGNVLLVGAKYFNSTENKMYIRNSSNVWQLDTADSSTVNYDDGTVQDVLDTAKPIADYTALRAYTGRATHVRITTPGIAGFFRRNGSATDNGGTVIVDGSGRSWERVFDDAVQISWFQVAADGTDQADKIQAAIDAAPDFGAIDFNVAGTVIVDTKTTRFVQTRNGKIYSALKISKPIAIRGNGSFLLKIKDFSTAWSSSALGDYSVAISVTSSFASVEDVRIDCNGRNHYKTFSGEKWWEYTEASNGSLFPVGMTTRPPNGVVVIPPAIDGASVVHTVVRNNKIEDCLAGVYFSGNLSSGRDATFLTGDHSTGTVKSCISERNTITGARGNAVIFVSGADSCESVNDAAVNCMYHAGRFYSMVTNCKIRNITEKVDAEAIIAKWNSTDNGYWRTDRTNTTIGGGVTLNTHFYKIQRCGVSFGGEWNFVGGQHNILNCTVDGFIGTFKKHPTTATHDTYYTRDANDPYYMAAVGSVQTPLGCIVRNVEADGYLQTLSFYAGAAPIAASKTGSVSAFDSISVNTDSRAAQINSINLPSIDGITCIDAGTANGDSTIVLTNCATPFIDGVQMGLKSKTGTRAGISFSGTTSAPVVGQYNADANYTLASRIIGNAASYPFKGSSLTSFSYQNSWVASSVLEAAPQYASTNATGIDSKSVSLQLCLNGVSATASTVLTLPSGYCPKALTTFNLIDAVSGKVCVARITTAGVVDVYMTAAASNYTALIGNITYPVM